MRVFNRSILTVLLWNKLQSLDLSGTLTQLSCIVIKYIRFLSELILIVDWFQTFDKHQNVTTILNIQLGRMITNRKNTFKKNNCNCSTFQIDYAHISILVWSKLFVTDKGSDIFKKKTRSMIISAYTYKSIKYWHIGYCEQIKNFSTQIYMGVRIILIVWNKYLW